jgi:hypothetical protein
MEGSTREREREQLEHQLDTETARALLRKVQRREDGAKEFGSWRAVAAYMHAGAADDPRKDAILRAIATSREEDRHPLWSSVLLVFFWPGLLTLFGKRRTWDPDPDELWQTIVVEFLEAVERLDVRRRRTRIATKLINDTYSRTYRAYEPRWRWLDREHPVEPEHFEPHAAAGAGINHAAIELRELQEQRLGFFREAFAAGVVGEDDLFLLIGTDVYGQSIADYARACGASYQALKKRRQRALAVIEAWRRDP